MTANTPILLQILGRLDSIDARLAVVETDVRVLKEDVKVLKEDVRNLKIYNKNESLIQEKKHASLLKKYLLTYDGNATIKIIQFGNFYLPYDKNPLTDIDGCVIQKKVPFFIKGVNKQSNIYDDGRVVFIESKHSITKTILDKKLVQFVKIIRAINQVQNNEYSPMKNEKYDFDDMIRIHDIKNFPKGFAFLLSTDKMSPDSVRLAVAITRGELTEEHYYDILYDYIMLHPILKDIQNDKSVNKNIVRSLINAKTVEEFASYLQWEVPGIHSTPKEKAEYKKKETLRPYINGLKSLLVPYNDYKDILTILKGKIGFISVDEIQLPEHVIQYGFNGNNRLLNSIYNS